MMATLRTSKKARIDAASARCSRASMTPTAVSVCSMGNSRRSTPSVIPACHPVALVAEHLDHPGVLRQHLGDEATQPAVEPGLREVLQQQLAQAPALVRVLDEEGDLGALVVQRVIAREADDVVAQGRDQGDPAVVVDGGEPAHVAIGQGRVGSEEAVVLRLVGDRP
jgi:hypothetical protein